jgi:hypothetical protein
MAGVVDKRPKLLTGERVTADEVVRERNLMPWSFVRIRIGVILRGAAHDERPSWDLHKSQECVVRQGPGIWAEAWIAKADQLIAGRNTLRRGEVWRPHTLKLLPLGDA